MMTVFDSEARDNVQGLGFYVMVDYVKKLFGKTIRIVLLGSFYMM